MVNYGHGKIYKIQQINGKGEICLGMTTKKYLSSRFDTLRANYKLWKEGKEFSDTLAFQIFDLYGINKCGIVVIEVTYGITSKDELKARLIYWIQKHRCLNTDNVVPENETPKCKNLNEYVEYESKQNIKSKPMKEKKISVVVNKIPVDVKKIEQKIMDDKSTRYTCEKCGMDVAKSYKGKHEFSDFNLKQIPACNFICECGKSILIHNKNDHYKTKYHIKRTVDIKYYDCECGEKVCENDKINHEKLYDHYRALKKIRDKGKPEVIPTGMCKCECGQIMLIRSKFNHLTTQKHFDRMKRHKEMKEIENDIENDKDNIPISYKEYIDI
jgi:hypothetical protein